ncbi:MAG: hypothetical protein M3Y08_21120 [Fibrobacterota bacterium]|nr:hypothetical protein [Fibrobacterota bacterium]
MMMKPILGMLAVALCLAACGSNQAMLAERGRSEAEQLQEFAKRAGLNNAETQRAEASLASATKHLKDGDDETAAAESDLAVTLFRLALARKDLTDLNAQVDLLKKGLAKDKEQLQTYQEILSEMKSTRKP